MVTKFYQHILALVFAIHEINEDPTILPNITLGFHIYDSYYDAKLTYRTTLDLLFKSHQFVPNYKCGTHKNLKGIIGGLSSETSLHMSAIIGLYKIPQVDIRMITLPQGPSNFSSDLPADIVFCFILVFIWLI